MLATGAAPHLVAALRPDQLAAVGLECPLHDACACLLDHTISLVPLDDNCKGGLDSYWNGRASITATARSRHRCGHLDPDVEPIDFFTPAV